MSEGLNMAILGATGAVGRAIIDLMMERELQIANLYLLASEKSAGETIRFNGKSILVQPAQEFDWSEVHMAFFVAGPLASQHWAEVAANAGCLVIDSSGLFCMDPDIPLVVADVNPHQLAEFRNRNIISVADSPVSQLLCALQPILAENRLSRIQVTHLRAVSSLGKSAVDALAGETAQLLNGIPAESNYFPRQLAFNLIPELPDADGSVDLERRLVEQTRKVLEDPGLSVTVTSIQAPVFYGNSQAVQVETAQPVSIEAMGQLLANNSEVELSVNDDFPTPVSDATESGKLCIGALRETFGAPEQFQFWSVADNIRFTGALMAVKIAERLIREYY